MNLLGRLISYILLIIVIAGCISKNNEVQPAIAFVEVRGINLIKPDGSKLLLQGTNLGNWLNPEGYMFLFKDVSSYRTINDAFCEMVGEDFTKQFWKVFQENYITKEDIHYIKELGMNSIRIPFHYKLFTNEDYMGKTYNQNGFALIDSVVSWCTEEELYVILDMHDAPGGQTGDNIDDGYGYPWLMVNENDKVKFCEIWKKIATHYADNTTIIGYDLLNEPIAHYFLDDNIQLNDSLETLYKRVAKEIRSVDKNHILILGGAQWNGNFSVFKDSNFDDKMMYTCHRYWCDTLQENIQDFVNFRDSVGLPIYMGETGENTDEWVASFRRLMERNNIGWHFWPYKKMNSERGIVSIIPPQNWETIVEYTQQDRSSFAKIRLNRPDQAIVKEALNKLLENIKYEYCLKNKSYINALTN